MRKNKKENLFLNLEDEESLYWLGFIATDGCISIRRYSYYMSIGLARRDREHLVKLKAFSGAKSEVNDYMNGKYPASSFQICSKVVCHRLEGLGLTRRKSKTLAVDYRLSKSVHFWRGAIDGDGSISFVPNKAIKRGDKTYYSDYLEVRIVSASKAFMEQFTHFLVELDIHKKVLMDKRKETDTSSPIYRVRITKKKDCLKLLKLMYVNNKVALTRKEELAFKVLDYYDML